RDKLLPSCVARESSGAQLQGPVSTGSKPLRKAFPFPIRTHVYKTSPNLTIQPHPLSDDSQQKLLRDRGLRRKAEVAQGRRHNPRCKSLGLVMIAGDPPGPSASAL